MSDAPHRRRATVVLVHGAFADGSSWNGVIERLQAQGVQRGRAPPTRCAASRPTPPTSPACSRQIAGPGARGRALVRRRGDQQRRHRRDERRRPRLRRGLRARRRRDAGRGRRDARRTACSARRSSRNSTRRRRRDGDRVLDRPGEGPRRVRRRPARRAGGADRPRSSGRWPRWRSPSRPARRPGRRLPSWAVVATGDKAAGTDVVRAMAERAGAQITEVDGSHVIMISQPEAVTDVILDAADAADARRAELEPAIAHRGRRSARQIDAGALDVGYVDVGPPDGPVVLLLHGWPYDIHSFAEVAPMLPAGGYRVIVPYLRGYGTTRFRLRRHGAQRPAGGPGRRRRSTCSTRCGIEQAIVGRVRLGRADGRRRGRAVARALHGLVSVSGYLIGSQAANRRRCRRRPSCQWWYQFYFATERGRAGYDRYRREFARADLAHRVAAVELRRRDVRPQRGVVRQPRPRRHRHPQLPVAARAGATASRGTTTWSSKLAGGPAITVPTITLEGDANGAPHPEPSRLRREVHRPSTCTGRSRAASGTTCPRKRRRRSSTPSSRSTGFRHDRPAAGATRARGRAAIGRKGGEWFAEHREPCRFFCVGLAGIEPATSSLSGMRSNRLSYSPAPDR